MFLFLQCILIFKFDTCGLLYLLLLCCELIAHANVTKAILLHVVEPFKGISLQRCLFFKCTKIVFTLYSILFYHNVWLSQATTRLFVLCIIFENSSVLACYIPVLDRACYSSMSTHDLPEPDFITFKCVSAWHYNKMLVTWCSSELCKSMELLVKPLWIKLANRNDCHNLSSGIFSVKFHIAV